jgi:colicin import membrane protein
MMKRSRSLSLGLATALAGITGVFDVALVSAQQSGMPKPSKPTTGLEDLLAPVTNWFERANREYQDTVVRQLSVPTGKGAQPNAGEVAKAPAPGQTPPSVLDQAKDWLGLSVPKPPASQTAAKPADPEAAAKAAERREAADAMRKQIEARELEAKRAAEEQRLAAEAKRAREALEQAAEQNRKTEAGRMAEDARKKELQAADDARRATAAAKEAEARKQGQDRQKAADEARIAAEEKARTEKSAAAAKDADERARLEKNQREAKLQSDRAAEEARVAAEKKAVAAEKVAEQAKRNVEQKTAEKQEAERRLANPAKPPDDPRPNEQKPAGPLAGAKEAASRLAQAANEAGSKALDKLGRGSSVKPKSIDTSQRSSLGAVRPVLEKSSSRRGASGKRCARAGQDVTTPGTYVVQAGDTLWSISRRHYERGSKYEKIARANEAKISDPDLIYPCQKFFLPERHAWLFPSLRAPVFGNVIILSASRSLSERHSNETLADSVAGRQGLVLR